MGSLSSSSARSETPDYYMTFIAGKRTMVVRGGIESNSCILEVWMGNRVTKELMVPNKLHGGVYNDGWFGNGAAWSSDESRVAYVAEVTPPIMSTLITYMSAQLVNGSPPFSMLQLLSPDLWLDVSCLIRTVLVRL